MPLPSPTNIVYVDVPDAPTVAGRLRERGVLVHATSPTRIRAVFHLDVPEDGPEVAAAAFAEVVGSPRGRD